MNALILIRLNVRFDVPGSWLPSCPDAAMAGFAGPPSFLVSKFPLVPFAHLPVQAGEQKEVYIDWIRECFIFFFDFFYFSLFSFLPIAVSNLAM